MFILYPFLFVAFYNFCKKYNPGPVALWKKMKEITKNGGDGPLNPVDDMPYRIMPHVVSCVSCVDTFSESKELSIRKKLFAKSTTHQGNDERYPVKEKENTTVPIIPEKETVEYSTMLKNIQRYELLQNLKNSKISESNKLTLLNLFDLTHGEAHLSYKENIFAAGLMKDWDFDF
jgi:hypothetical protein